MGCWEETCAVTRTSIKAGEPVFVLWTNITWITTTYHLAGERASQLYLEVDKAKFSKIGIDIMKNFTESSKEKRRILNWRFGTYNEYGFIEEEELPSDCHCFLIHKNIAVLMAKLGRKATVKHEKSIDPVIKNDFVSNLCYAAGLARIQLFNNKLLGQQHRDSEEMFFIIKLTILILFWQIKMLIKDSLIVEWIRYELIWKIEKLFKRK